MTTPSSLEVYTHPLINLKNVVTGAMFILEHRYYGKSRPVPDLSVKNLAWLSSHQVTGPPV